MSPPIVITTTKGVQITSDGVPITTPATTKVVIDPTTPLLKTPASTKIFPGTGGSSVTINTGSHRTNVVPLGAIDGVNTVFTSPEDFVHNGLSDEMVYLRGLRRISGVGSDYVASESGGVGTGYDTVTFLDAPKSGDILLLDYFLTTS